MISKNLLKKMNEQIVHELFASNAYLATACHLDDQDLRVLSAYFMKHSAEERDHALKIVNYLLEIGAPVKIGAIPEPKSDFASVREAVEHGLESEKHVTALINELMTIAHEDNDYASISFLRWFVDEQVEEEAQMQELLGLIKHAGDQHMLLVEDRLLKKGIGLEEPGAAE